MERRKIRNNLTVWTCFSFTQGGAMKHAGNSARLAISIVLFLNGLFALDRLDRTTNTPPHPRSPSISPSADTINRELPHARSTPSADERGRARIRKEYGKLPM